MRLCDGGKMNNNNIKVSVLCTAYNHEQYIRRCLDGFVSQKTNFQFEVLVNDDNSSDNTARIIEEYVRKYPNIIKAFLQKENQFSKKVRINDDILYPHAKGKYIALCEGDDYWIDCNKLQKQYDYMESNLNCSMVLHNTYKHDISGKKSDKMFNTWKDIHVLSDEEIFFGWHVHTSSYFFRRNCALIPDCARNFWSGDYARLVWASFFGIVVALPEVMSVYNYGISSGVTMRNLSSSYDKGIEREKARVQMLRDVNSLTDFKKDGIISRRIQADEFEMLRMNALKKIVTSNCKKDIIQSAKNITSDKRFKNYIKKLSLTDKIKQEFKFRGYIIYPLWIEYLRKYYKKRG